MNQSPFKGVNDPFFFLIADPTVLREHEIDVPEPVFRAACREACEHFHFATELFGAHWWKKLDHEDEVDVAHEERSLYPFVANKLGIELNPSCPKTARQMEYLRDRRLIPKIAKLLSFIFNEMIRHKRTTQAPG